MISPVMAVASMASAGSGERMDIVSRLVHERGAQGFCRMAGIYSERGAQGFCYMFVFLHNDQDLDSGSGERPLHRS